MLTKHWPTRVWASNGRQFEPCFIWVNDSKGESRPSAAMRVSFQNRALRKSHKRAQTTRVRFCEIMRWVTMGKKVSTWLLLAPRTSGDCEQSACWPRLWWLGYTIIKTHKVCTQDMASHYPFLFQFFQNCVSWNKTIPSVLIVLCHLTESREVESLTSFSPILCVFMRIPICMMN